MGGSVSAGKDNDDLVDNLIEARYVRTPTVEKVLRTVDRAFYYLSEFSYSAYRDVAWKHGNLHLSAPCIYSEVLEHLSLEPGLSFLNIGSGTGYLNTMVGLILGPYGVNHGIEIQPDVVDYAYEKLEQFKTTCNGVDVFEFCEPYFTVGNVFDLSHARRYDRIYCGAACPEMYHEHIKKYMKIGGILVMPCGDDLLKVVRNSETSWEMTSLLSVSFSTLQMAGKHSSNLISMADPHPLRLQELCRAKIRTILRNICEKENPELTQKRKRKRTGRSRNRRYSSVIIPIYEGMSAGNEDASVRVNRNIIFHNYSTATFRNLIRDLRRSDHNEGDGDADDNENENAAGDETGSSDTDYHSDIDYHSATNDSRSRLQQSTKAVARPTESGADPTVPTSWAGANTTTTTAASGITSDCNDSSSSSSSNTSSSSSNSSFSTSRGRNDSSSSSSGSNSSPNESMDEVKNTSVEISSSSSEDNDEFDTSTRSYASSLGAALTPRKNGHTKKSKKVESMDDEQLPVTDEISEARELEETSSGNAKGKPERNGRRRCGADGKSTPSSDGEHDPQKTYESNQNIRKQADDINEDDDDQPKKLLKREKLDSGISISEESDDEKVSKSNESSSSYSESNFSEAMDLESDDSESVNRMMFDEQASDGNAANDTRSAPAYDSLPLKYRKALEPKIRALPLPQSVKIYLNYRRPFEFS